VIGALATRTTAAAVIAGILCWLLLSSCAARPDNRFRSDGVATPTPVPTATSPTPTEAVPERIPAPAPSFRPAVGIYVVADMKDPDAFDRDLAEVVEAGSAWIRIGIPSWVAGRVDKGEFVPNEDNVGFYVDAVKKADAAHLKIAFIQANAHNDDAWTDEQFRAYNTQYWKYISSKFGRYVDLWQVFNEHDSADFRNHQPLESDEAFPDGYLDRLRLTLVAARAALRSHSKAPITSPPLGYPLNEDRYARWQTFFDAVGTTLDVISVHAYPGSSAETINLVPTYLDRLKERYDKPVAVTEFGVPSVPSSGSDESIGAAIAAQLDAIGKADPLCAIVYQLRDRGVDTGDSEAVFGLVRHDFTRKAYYDTVVAEIKEENFSVTASRVSSGTVKISWTPVAGSTGYVVGRDGQNLSGGGPWSARDPAKARSREFTGLRPGTDYTFTVTAVPSDLTKTVSVTTTTH
jgi:hypothetical protein